MFLYETLNSSNEFCDALIANDIDFDNFLSSDNNFNENISISETIKDSSWFYLSWQDDSTIQSMLRMLDAIHLKFKGRPEFFERLLNTENPIITFLFLNLKDFKLSDDLYFKMNSRGKTFTAFEGFKANFVRHLEGVSTDRIFSLDLGDGPEQVSIKKYFLSQY
ncbi:MAG: hypothetical protein U5L09_01795 [Bacteroidales bacterium]|nr:hypothetical protein [Bacteroidales bacterium]